MKPDGSRQLRPKTDSTVVLSYPGQGRQAGLTAIYKITANQDFFFNLGRRARRSAENIVQSRAWARTRAHRPASAAWVAVVFAEDALPGTRTAASLGPVSNAVCLLPLILLSESERWAVHGNCQPSLMELYDGARRAGWVSGEENRGIIKRHVHNGMNEAAALGSACRGSPHFPRVRLISERRGLMQSGPFLQGRPR